MPEASKRHSMENRCEYCSQHELIDRLYEQLEAHKDVTQKWYDEAHEKHRENYLLKKEMRKEFFRILPDLDYAETIPGSSDDDNMHAVYDWAWAQHPWFSLLNLTRDECIDALQGVK